MTALAHPSASGATLRHIVLDFDGTCTRVEDIHAAFLSTYRAMFRQALETAFAGAIPGDTDALWDDYERLLRHHSPVAGWRLAGGPPSAPVAADPYILAGETAKLVTAQLRLTATGRPPVIDFGKLHHDADQAEEAPWREEVPEVLAGLVELGLSVAFVSNSSTVKIGKRLDALLGSSSSLRKSIQVFSDAQKFSIEELPLDELLDAPLPKTARQAFAALPAAEQANGLDRPIYVRRGQYLRAMTAVWGPDMTATDIAGTLVCGDIYELDLAMPKALGGMVHLVDRQAPFETCGYERAALPDTKHQSADLRGLLTRARALVARG